jgi:hypothetical protein
VKTRRGNEWDGVLAAEHADHSVTDNAGPVAAMAVAGRFYGGLIATVLVLFGLPPWAELGEHSTGTRPFAEVECVCV